jgi:nucleoid-associated protein YgaU
MRRSSATLWLSAVVGLAACARPTAAAPSGDALVLELGGGQGSLRQALVAAGVDAPAPAPVITPPAAAAPRPQDESVDPPAVAPAPPQPDHIVVELGRGETLIHLAKKYLGDGNRFREILTANGWTERDARRLPAGQAVKVPLDPSSAPR